MELLIIFIVLNVINVILQTVRSIATINCGRTVAALANAVAYGLYQVIMVLAVCELPLWEKVLIVALANFVGVFVTKTIQKKMEKDKLWEVKVTVKNEKIGDFTSLHNRLVSQDVSFNYIHARPYVIFRCYCATQEETKKVKEIFTPLNAKFFASENKFF